MDNRETLTKAIEKIINSGLESTWCAENGLIHGYVANDTGTRWEVDPAYVEPLWDMRHRLIFSHDFAKAFWGEGFEETRALNNPIPDWQFHLQEMVLEENPLAYLSKFL